MLKDKINMIVDLQWGSCGKGKFSAWLADRHNVMTVSNSNGPNSGHTVVIDGKKFVTKVIPSASVLPGRTALLSSGSQFVATRLIEECGFVSGPVVVHPRAVEVEEYDVRQERSIVDSIASTGQGGAAALCRKIMRQRSSIFRFPALVSRYGTNGSLPRVASSCEEFEQMLSGTVLHEIAQGFELSIDHGSDYPQCTYRNSTPAAALDQLGLPVQRCGHVYGVFRPYPIRVGNTMSSSGSFGGAQEISWDEIARRCGADIDLKPLEHTTVTKRLRRVAELDLRRLANAVSRTGTTHLLLNFAQYVDWEITKTKEPTNKILDFVKQVEQATGVKVVAIGYGADHADTIAI